MTPAPSSGPLLSARFPRPHDFPRNRDCPARGQRILCEPTGADYRNESDSAVGKSEGTPAAVDGARRAVPESRPLPNSFPNRPFRGAQRQEMRDDDDCPCPPVGARLIGFAEPSRSRTTRRHTALSPSVYRDPRVASACRARRRRFQHPLLRATRAELLGARALRPAPLRNEGIFIIMLAIEFEQLSALGLTPALANRAAGLAVGADAASELLRITAVHRSTVGVHDGRAERSARPLPRLVARARATRALRSRSATGCSPRATRYGETWIEARVPPSSHIARRDGDGRIHPVVSNVDTALLVMGLDDDFNPRRLERYLALVHGDAIVPVVVLTKADVAAPTRGRAGRAPGNARRTRSRSRRDLRRERDGRLGRASRSRGYLGRGQTLVLLGSSGAGKSTLTNTLLGAAVQDTGAVRLARQPRQAHDDVAVAASAAGRRVRDRHARLAHAASGCRRSHARRRYDDIATLAAQCRFRDCRHAEEPGCAVREGIGADRLRNYHKLLARGAPRHDDGARPAAPGSRNGKRGDAQRRFG